MSGQNRINAFHNHLRLELLIRKVICPVLRDLFKRRYLLWKGKEWKDGLRSNRQFFSEGPYSSRIGWQQIQTRRLLTGDLEQMDLSLLATLILYLQWRGTPEATLERENKSVESVKVLRNNLAHLAGFEYEYSECWERVKQDLTSLVAEESGQEALMKEIDFIRTTDDLDGLEFNPPVIAESMELADDLFKQGRRHMDNEDYRKAIEVSTLGLELQGLSRAQQVKLYLSRFAAHTALVVVENGECIWERMNRAYEDVRAMIELQPTSWLGYYQAAHLFQLMSTVGQTVTTAKGSILSDDIQYDCVDLCEEYFQVAKAAYRMWSTRQGNVLNIKPLEEALSQPTSRDIVLPHLRSLLATLQNMDRALSESQIRDLFGDVWHAAVVTFSGRRVPDAFRLEAKTNFLESAALLSAQTSPGTIRSALGALQGNGATGGMDETYSGLDLAPRASSSRSVQQETQDPDMLTDILGAGRTIVQQLSGGLRCLCKAADKELEKATEKLDNALSEVQHVFAASQTEHVTTEVRPTLRQIEFNPELELD